MKKISGLLLIGFALTSNIVLAQSFSESALLFSRTRPGGSARIQAMGGAQVSLGGDYSSAASNPAGLGMYNRSEFAITPSFGLVGIKTSYLDNSTNTNKSNLSLPGFTVAFHKNSERGEGFMGGTFSITHNRINDFNSSMSYQGTNPDNSVIDYFLNQAVGYPPSQFDKNGDMYNTVTELAYDNYLIGEKTIIDPNNSPKDYFSDVGGIPFQKETIDITGSQGQWNFSYGANFDDKFFLGASVGLTSLRYKSKKVYTETFKGEPLDNLNLQENLDITGSGINFNLGGILRPIDHVQIGLAFSTPTMYQISDSYKATMTTKWNNFQYDANKVLNNESASTDLVVSEYSLSTPWKLSAGFTYFFGKSGLITADIEQMSYNKTKYSSAGSSSYTSNDATADNKDIKSLYQNTTNVRLGGEYRYKAYRVRGGFNYMGDPFAEAQNGVNRSIAGVSGGVGYRSEKFYIDFAVTYFNGKNSYRPYTVPTNSPLVTYGQKNTNVVVTLGFPF